MKSIKILSGNYLKIIAAIAMVFDHIAVNAMLFGYTELFFPGDLTILRIIGRLAFPIFAYFIAEGCKYTRNRVRYLATLAGAAVVFQAVYILFLQSWYMSIFVTFTFSIILIYLLDECKKAFVQKGAKLWRKIGSVAAFILALALVYLITKIEYEDFMIDYEFWGCVTPVFASLFHAPKDAPEKWKTLDKPYLGALCMIIPLLGLSHFYYATFHLQWVGLFAVPLLLLYSGKRGKRKMKYFFYIFYPVHLVLLYAIFYLRYLLR